MCLMHYILITCLTPVYVHVSHSISTHYLTYTYVSIYISISFSTHNLFNTCVYTYRSQSVHITWLTSVYVLVSISLNVNYLYNTCASAIFQFTTYHLYVHIYLSHSVQSISAAPVSVWLHMYTCISIIKSVQITSVWTCT